MNHLGQMEGEIKALFRVQPWIALRCVVKFKMVVLNLPSAANAFGHILPGHLQMDATRNGPFRSVNRITSYNVCYTKLLRDGGMAAGHAAV